MKLFKNIIWIVLIVSLTGFVSDKNKLSDKQDEITASAIIQFNNITIPVYECGQIGDRVVRNTRYRGPGGYLDTNIFVSSSGFFLSGYNEKGHLWANGVQPSLGIKDYQRGTVESGRGVLGYFNMTDDMKPFGVEWVWWNAAVELGAEYYDGNNDGEYDPVDLNKNGAWDPNEDRPGIYGNATSWSVFNDAVSADSRKTNGVEPQGIEIRQTVWAHRNNPDLENVLFIKYTLLNTGTASPIHRDVVFSAAVDPSLGYPNDDLCGFDSTLEAGYTYYNNRDRVHNNYSLSFLVSQIEGPKKITNNPEDVAYTIINNEFDVIEESGAINNRINAFRTIDAVWWSNFNNFYSTPEKLRNAMTGLDNPYPCDDPAGVVVNDDCRAINHRMMYSGNLLKNKGWINNRPRNKFFMITTEPFDLVENEPIDLIFAFIVGTGETGMDALIDAKKRAKKIKYQFFEKPQNLPDVNPIVIAGEESIELIWDTTPFFNFTEKGYRYNLSFEGFKVYMYNSPIPEEEVDGTNNSALIAKYDISNGINSLLIEDPDDFHTDVFYTDGIQLDYNKYGNRESGKLILKIDRDPFTKRSLIKGRPYFISINSFAINKDNLIMNDIRGSYIIPESPQFGIIESMSKIINDENGNNGIVLGEQLNDTYFKDIELQHTQGSSEAFISYSVYDKNQVTDDIYELSFTEIENEFYGLYYNLKNISTGVYLRDSVNLLEDNSGVQNISDGFILDIEWIEPRIENISYEGDKWFTDFDEMNTGVFYVGSDYEDPNYVFAVTRKLSKAISFDKTKHVELVFADTSKAYRYVRRAVRYTWHGQFGPDSGFVDIPVSAYSVDQDGNRVQLTMGFIENAFMGDPGGIPDGIWNPGPNIVESKEYLVVFDSEYSEDLNTHIAYTGIDNKWADIAHGYTLRDVNDLVNDSIRAVAKSPWFDAMYIIGFETDVYQPELGPTGKLIIEPSPVLTPNDKYILKVKRDKTIDEEKEQFDKINVFPNPLLGYNAASSSFGTRADEPFVTFSNLPHEVNIKIYTLDGTLIRTILKNDLSSLYRWDLQNESGYRVASGMYLAIVESPGIGQKVLKIAIIMPQKQVHFE